MNRRTFFGSSIAAAVGSGLLALSAQAALIPVFDYQFPASYDGTVSTVVDLSGAGHNGIATGHPLTLSANVPAGAAVGSQSIDFVAKAGRINTSNIDLLTSTAVAAAGGFTYDVWFNPTGVNTGNYRKIIDNAGTEYLGYITGAGNTSPTFVTSVGNTAVSFAAPAFAFNPNGWNHVVMEFDTNGAALVGGNVSGDMKLIINDVSYALGARTMSNFGDVLNRSISIAQHPLGGEQFNGLVHAASVSLGIDSPTLLGHWKLNERTGSFAADSSGNGFHGTYLNGPVLGVPSANEGVNPGVDFDGVNDTVSLGSPNAFKMQNDFTVMAWVKPDSLGGVQRIFSQTSPGGFGFGLVGDELRLTTFGVLDYDTTGVDLTTGIFQHVAVVFTTGNDALFYVDGELVATVLGVNPVNMVNSNFFIGSTGGNEFFNGVIDDVRFYRGALSQEQIAAIIHIPEPASALLLVLAGAACMTRRRQTMA